MIRGKVMREELMTAVKTLILVIILYQYFSNLEFRYEFLCQFKTGYCIHQNYCIFKKPNKTTLLSE